MYTLYDVRYCMIANRCLKLTINDQCPIQNIRNKYCVYKLEVYCIIIFIFTIIFFT